jgi:nucleoside-diphosphate-sugar epimerase
MRVVVTGATGNVGTSVVERLTEQGVEVVGVARRDHDWRPAGVEWARADLSEDDLVPVLRGADAVVHLAWLFQPVRHPQVTWRNNVGGTQRVLQAVEAAEVPTVVVASSVGAYSPRDGLAEIDESWPTDGVPVTAYSREKAYVERLLDVHQERHPSRRVVRLRPAFTFQHRSAVQQRRLFLGPFVPQRLVRPGRVPVLPVPRDLRLQLVHTDDVASAYAMAVASPQAQGAYNITSQPTLGPAELAEELHARWVPTPARLLRAGLTAAHAAHVVPAAPELFDLLMSAPVMSAARAHAELGWQPRLSAQETLHAFLEGLRRPTDASTPPLDPSTSGPARWHEVASGVGETDSLR